MHSLSTNTLLFCAIGSLEKAIKILKDNGFKTFDLSLSWLVEQCDTFIDKDDYKERAKSFKKYADSLQMVCNQCHSFMKLPHKTSTKEENDFNTLMAKRCIEVAGIMNCPNIVMHPLSDYSFDENVKWFRKFSKIAKENNVNIAIENMPTGIYSDHDSINKLLKTINRKNVGLCLDIGHAEIRKTPSSSSVEIIGKCHKYLLCLHIDDNDKVDDSHLLPGDGEIDFKAIMECLGKNGYQGDLTMEADNYFWPQKMEERINLLPSLLSIGEELLAMLNANFTV